MPIPLPIRPFKKYSQFNEDGIIQSIFDYISIENKYFVEIGCGSNASECNTRLLREQGWTGLQIDLLSKTTSVLSYHIDKDNVNTILSKYKVPKIFDLFSLDIDSNDYWVLQSFLTQYSPRVIVCEYNCYFGPHKSVSLQYNPNQKWDGISWNYGASLAAFDKLLTFYNFKLICTSNGTNAFWICQKDVLKYDILVPTRESIFTRISRTRKFIDTGWINI